MAGDGVISLRSASTEIVSGISRFTYSPRDCLKWFSRHLTPRKHAERDPLPYEETVVTRPVAVALPLTAHRIVLYPGATIRLDRVSNAVIRPCAQRSPQPFTLRGLQRTFRRLDRVRTEQAGHDVAEQHLASSVQYLPADGLTQGELEQTMIHERLTQLSRDAH